MGKKSTSTAKARITVVKNQPNVRKVEITLSVGGVLNLVRVLREAGDKGDALALDALWFIRNAASLPEANIDLNGPEVDFKVTNNGTTWGFTPLTEKAKQFAGGLGLEGWQWLGGSFNLDHRPAAQLAEQLQEEGFVLN